jgi:hypothetical protein
MANHILVDFYQTANCCDVIYIISLASLHELVRPAQTSRVDPSSPQVCIIVSFRSLRVYLCIRTTSFGDGVPSKLPQAVTLLTGVCSEYQPEHRLP